MTSLPRLHWSTLGGVTGGLEQRWSTLWDVTVDRGTAPALPPTETDLWVINVKGQQPLPELLRLVPEVGALPLLLLLTLRLRP